MISKPREPARLAGKAKTRVDAEKSRGQTAEPVSNRKPEGSCPLLYVASYILRLMTTTQHDKTGEKSFIRPVTRRR